MNNLDCRLFLIFPLCGYHWEWDSILEGVWLVMNI
jgi:hypothetical protein